MRKRNVKSVLKLLTNSVSNGILPLFNKKYSEPKESSREIIPQDPFSQIHRVESLPMHAAMLTNGGSGPSGLGADGWQRILTSSQF